jgi:hypothetical protein
MYSGVPMRLDRDIMVALHVGEMTPEGAFAAQAARDEGRPEGSVSSLTERYAAARADIAATGPDVLRELLAAHEALSERMGAAWSECERNSRRREIVTAWEVTQGSKPL